MDKILIIEDEKKLSDAILDDLTAQNYNCLQAFDGELGLLACKNFNPDVILLDINLPKINGFDLIPKIRLLIENVPIIMLTAFGDIDSKIMAFDNGADDYLVKPINFKELVAKIKIFIRRNKKQLNAENKIVLKDIFLDLGMKTVSRGGIDLNLTPKEFDLFHYLLQKSGRVVSKEELAREVWSERYGVTPNTIEVYVSFLRNKIDKNFEKKLIKTKPGFGYFVDVD